MKKVCHCLFALLSIFTAISACSNSLIEDVSVPTSTIKINPTLKVMYTPSATSWPTNFYIEEPFLDDKRWSKFVSTDAKSHGFYDIAVDSQDKLWFAGNNFVVNFDGNSWIKKDIENIDLKSRIETIAITNDSVVWIGWVGNIASFNGQDWITYTGVINANEHLWDMAINSKGELLVGTDYRVLHYANQKWFSSTYVDTGLSSVRTITKDSDGKLWFAGQSGVSIFDGVEWVKIQDFGGESTTVMCIAVLDSNNIWLGFGNSISGVMYFDGKKWSKYGENIGLNRIMVLSVFIDNQKALWVSGIGGTISFDGQNWSQYPITAWDIVQTHDGAMWFASEEGIFRFVPKPNSE